MRERVALECILDIAEMNYLNTGDKWWLKLSIEVAKKKGKKK